MDKSKEILMLFKENEERAFRELLTRSMIIYCFTPFNF